MVTVGTDIVDVARVRDAAPTFVSRILRPDEEAYCHSTVDPPQHIAARFAAKEAVFKALQPESPNSIAWHDIEILRADHGVPQVRLWGAARKLADERGVTRIQVSLSHVAEFALAAAVCEWEDRA